MFAKVIQRSVGRWIAVIIKAVVHQNHGFGVLCFCLRNDEVGVENEQEAREKKHGLSQLVGERYIVSGMFSKIRHSISRRLRAWFPDREIEYEAIILVLVIGLTAVLLVLPTPPIVRSVSPHTTAEWRDMVAQYNIAPRDGENIRETVPRIYLERFPDDWPSELTVSARKRLFVSAMLPLVLAENERVRSERARMLPLLDKLDRGERLYPWSKSFLEKLSESYGLDAVDPRILRLRIAPVPVSLALAQAAIESGWGTSRFAKEGNAVFGQWVWNDAAGIIPDARREGASHAVRRFDNLSQSVHAYIRNLNTHRAYREFRRQRDSLMSDQLENETGISGDELASTLIQYSERREKYIDELRAVIRVNKFEALSSMRLGDGMTLQVSRPESPLI